MTEDTYTITAPWGRRSQIRKNLERLGRKFARIDRATITPFSVTESAPFWEPVYNMAGRIICRYKAVHLTVPRSAFSVSPSEEYRLVALGERRGAAVTVTYTSEEATTAEVDMLLEADGSCAHCNTTRARKLLALIWGPSGLQVVGRSCLQDATGSHAHLLLANLQESMRDLSEEYFSPASEARELNAKVAICLALEALGEVGFVRSSEDASTSGVMRELWFDDKLKEERREAINKHYERAEEILPRICASLKEQKSVFAQATLSIFEAEWVTSRDFGRIAFAVYQALGGGAERKPRAPKLPTGGRFAPKGERFLAEGKLVHWALQESHWGTSYLCIFAVERDGQAFKLITFSSSAAAAELNIGDIYTFRGTADTYSEGYGSTRFKRLSILAQEGN
jgi:hypothetical protein